MTNPTSERPCMLVVDDEEGLRMSLRAVFHNQFELVLCKNSAEAMAAIKAHNVMVAILDIKMVGESGLDLLRRIKETAPLVEVIMLTAYETMDAVKTAVRQNACDFLSKPFDIPTLTESVNRAMRLRAASDAAHAAMNSSRHLNTEMMALQDGVLHDTRNILTVVTGMASLVKTRLSGKDAIAGDALVSANEEMDVLTRQLHTGVELLSRYLNALRRSRGFLDVADVRSALENISHLLATHPDCRNTRFRFVAPPSGPLIVRMDPLECFQIVFNLALNAAQSSKQRQEVTIEARIVTETLNLEGMQDTQRTKRHTSPQFVNQPPWLAVSVSDHGEGIPPEVLGRLFQPYVTTRQTGTGIGIPLIGRLITKNKGLFYIDTVPGKGTAMTVYLPQ